MQPKTEQIKEYEGKIIHNIKYDNGDIFSRKIDSEEAALLSAMWGGDKYDY